MISRAFDSVSKFKSAFLLTLGAENETRTRDPNLGKVVLYQLSYFRVWDCKGTKDFINSKSFCTFFAIIPYFELLTRGKVPPSAPDRYMTASLS